MVSSTATADSPEASDRPWSGASVGSLALRALRRHPDRTAFVDDGSSLTYAGAADLIGRLQHVLARRGLSRGSRIGLLGDNSARSWCLGIAAQASGMAVSYLHPLGSLPDHLHQLADLDAAACVVASRDAGERGHELAAGAGDVTILGLGSDDAGPDLLTEAADGGTARAVDVSHADDVALVMYTGGTSGTPKGVVRRQHSAAVIMSLASRTDFEFPERPDYLAVAPISHVSGAKILPVLGRGGTVHLQNGFDAGRVLRTIGERRISMTLMVPTMIQALLADPGIDDADTSSMELLLYGASPIAPDLLARGIERFGPVFSQLYGQTECYPISVLTRSDHDDPSLAGSCGFPVGMVRAEILDADGQPVPVGEPGEVCLRGPGVMEGYWRRPELTAETFAHGRLHTGDVARSDDRGYLSIVGRIKEMIVTGGFNVFPREIEDALTGHPAVRAAAVFGVPDDRWGEAVTAAVVLRPGTSVGAAELTDHVRRLKGPHQAPKNVRLLAELPTTAVGKVDKVWLRDNPPAGDGQDR